MQPGKLQNQNPKLIDQFWQKFIRQKVLLAIALQSALVAIVGELIFFTGHFTLDSWLFWTVIAAALIISVLISIYLTYSTTKTTKTLLSTILDVSNEQNELAPPEPNTDPAIRYATQMLYDLALKRNKTTDKKQVSSVSVAQKAVNMSNCGFIALDSAQKIIFANDSAPISVDSDGTKKLKLLFNGNDNIESWLVKCVKDEVKADHIWTRVPDKLPNEEERHFFDVIASYRKGLSPETVLVLIDRTAVYTNDEEDLDFIAFAAHELRGPITVIKGYVDILQDELGESLKGDQEQLFHRLMISSNQLSGYIDNILNTSRYDRRHLKVHLAEAKPSEVYEIIADDMALRASSQNRLLSVNIPDDLPTIAVDKGSMSEVFSNLIDNAIKYSNVGGTIEVSARVNGDFVEVYVEDHGIGMPESVVSNLFKKFYRSHRSRETVAGTGIGLYISKAIVESHGGNISVRSRDGYGSTFTVSIPIYEKVADKLKTDNNSNEKLIKEGDGWIKNHSMYRG